MPGRLFSTLIFQRHSSQAAILRLGLTMSPVLPWTRAPGTFRSQFPEHQVCSDT